jgi:hypothetical protein
MKLTTGFRVRSQVCATECIVLRVETPETDLRCGGHSMIPLAETAAPGLSIDPALSGGSLLGKRYVDNGGLEVLVTRAGVGTLSVGDAPLEVKAAKSLPASD